MPRKSVAGAIESAGVLAGMVPGGQAIAATAPLIAGILRGFGISRVSADAMKQKGGRRAKKGRGAARRRAKRGGGVQLAPRVSTVNRPSVPAQFPARVPATYQRSAVAPNRRDGVRISACEGGVFNVTSTNGAAPQFGAAFNQIAPDNTTLFPWLSDLSDIYTKFYFRKLVLHFVPVKGTTSEYTIFMAYNPDPYMDTGVDFAAVMQMAQKQQGQVWQPMSLAVNLPEEGSEPFYIDNDGADDRLESQGSVLLGQNGDSGTGTPKNYGQLFVEYEVDLYDRKPSALTLLAKKMRAAMLNRGLPTELRIKCGYAMVEEIVKNRPARAKPEDKQLILLRAAEALIPQPLGRGTPGAGSLIGM